MTTTPRPHVQRVQIGEPDDINLSSSEPGARVRTAIAKRPVAGPIWVTPTGLTGDSQVDRRIHGGPDRALCAYPLAHLAYWSQKLRRPIPVGGVGENLTVVAQDEQTIAIGDTYGLGGCIIQVTSPRWVCRTLGASWGTPDLPLRLRQLAMTGWYLRVLQPGPIEAGQPLKLLARPFPHVTIAAVLQARYDRLIGRRPDSIDVAELAACPVLAGDWRAAFARQASRQPSQDPSDPELAARQGRSDIDGDTCQ
jgi:MOSC domain-containing protein YiiM